MMEVFRNILLASDGSSHALRAAEKAAELAKLSNGLITILYIIDPSRSKSEVLSVGDTDALEDKRKKRLQETEEVFLKHELEYTVKILKGEPGPSIVHYANDNKFELVVIGSRGLNSFQEMVLGSVSHKVAKRAECPVLIVK